MKIFAAHLLKYTYRPMLPPQRPIGASRPHIEKSSTVQGGEVVLLLTCIQVKVMCRPSNPPGRLSAYPDRNQNFGT